ncbi:hypothetical protein CONLIGDRAFT_675735 [Coniochaeta ligniaria NRRL 30616]|uniref:Uncharacterized protein n=1 Tax=Coniochaeta ligniaria NRRL 30616 TaxID=1408157 RepID=A0A1J7J5Y4_9PEZI|nr:hypothetical protein CONLIGDRAFT_675735 [Coniochaeta ligniaria NRRL 30616]
MSLFFRSSRDDGEDRDDRGRRPARPPSDPTEGRGASRSRPPPSSSTSSTWTWRGTRGASSYANDNDRPESPDLVLPATRDWQNSIPRRRDPSVPAGSGTGTIRTQPRTDSYYPPSASSRVPPRRDTSTARLPPPPRYYAAPEGYDDARGRQATRSPRDASRSRSRPVPQPPSGIAYPPAESRNTERPLVFRPRPPSSERQAPEQYRRGRVDPSPQSPSPYRTATLSAASNTSSSSRQQGRAVPSVSQMSSPARPSSVREPSARGTSRQRQPSIGRPAKRQPYDNDLDNFRLMMKVKERNDPYAMPVRPDSNTFIVAGGICNLGLNIMESQDGFRCLVMVGEKVLRGRAKDGAIPDFITRDYTVSYWADFFIRKIRQDFPNVEVATIASYARSRRFDWDGDPRRFRPKMACSLMISRDHVDRLRSCRRDAQSSNDEATKQYRSLGAFMGMAIAHELCHMFITFLNGGEHQDTPDNSNYDPETGMAKTVSSDGGRSDAEPDPGHSGRVWEYYMWEGIVEYSYLRERPTRGLIYISREGTRPGQVEEYMVPDGIAHELAVKGRDFDFTLLSDGARLIRPNDNTLRQIMESEPGSRPELVVHMPATMRAWESKPKYRLSGTDLRRVVVTDQLAVHKAVYLLT